MTIDQSVLDTEGGDIAALECRVRDLLMQGQRIHPGLAGEFSHPKFSQLVGDAQQALAEDGNFILARQIDLLFPGDGIIGEGPIIQNGRCD